MIVLFCQVAQEMMKKREKKRQERMQKEKEKKEAGEEDSKEKEDDSEDEGLKLRWTIKSFLKVLLKSSIEILREKHTLMKNVYFQFQGWFVDSTPEQLGLREDTRR